MSTENPNASKSRTIAPANTAPNTLEHAWQYLGIVIRQEPRASFMRVPLFELVFSDSAEGLGGVKRVLTSCLLVVGLTLAPIAAVLLTTGRDSAPSDAGSPLKVGLLVGLSSLAFGALVSVWESVADGLRTTLASAPFALVAVALATVPAIRPLLSTTGDLDYAASGFISAVQIGAYFYGRTEWAGTPAQPDRRPLRTLVLNTLILVVVTFTTVVGVHTLATWSGGGEGVGTTLKLVFVAPQIALAALLLLWRADDAWTWPGFTKRVAVPVAISFAVAVVLGFFAGDNGASPLLATHRYLLWVVYGFLLGLITSGFVLGWWWATVSAVTAIPKLRTVFCLLASVFVVFSWWATLVLVFPHLKTDKWWAIYVAPVGLVCGGLSSWLLHTGKDTSGANLPK